MRKKYVLDFKNKRIESPILLENLFNNAFLMIRQVSKSIIQI